MTDEIVIKEIEVSKLSLRPGDVLVVHLPEATRATWMQKLSLHLTKLLPRTPCLLLAKDVKLEVMTVEKARELAKDKKEISSG